MNAYFEKARSVKMSAVDALERRADRAKFLFANNMRARIEFARIAAEQIDKKLKSLGDRTYGFWITLSPANFAVAEVAAADFNVHRLHSWVHQEMRGLSYVGMVDIALFTNVQFFYGQKRAVHWHAHLIAWGDGELVDQKKASINARFEPFIAGRLAAHSQAYLRGALVGRVYYMCKAPMSEYRIHPVAAEVADPSTGELLPAQTFDQFKDRLTPSDIAKLYRITAHRWIDKMAFAGGEGQEVLATIRHEALDPLRRYQASHPGNRPVE